MKLNLNYIAFIYLYIYMSCQYEREPPSPRSTPWGAYRSAILMRHKLEGNDSTFLMNETLTGSDVLKLHMSKDRKFMKIDKKLWTPNNMDEIFVLTFDSEKKVWCNCHLWPPSGAIRILITIINISALIYLFCSSHPCWYITGTAGLARQNSL